MRKSYIVPQVISLIILATFFSVPSLAQTTDEDYTYIDFDTSVKLALDNSYDILISYEEISSAARQVESAARSYYPKVRIQGAARADIFELDQFSSDSVTYGLILDWNPYQSGELLRRNAEAKLNFYIARLDREQAVIDIVFGIQDLYYDILKSQYSLEVDEFSLDIERRKLEFQEAEFKARNIKEADLLAARSEFYEKELSLERARQAYGLKLIRLRNRIQKEDFTCLADVERNIISELSFSLDDCIDTAYITRRKYITARERHTLAKLGVKYSKLKRFPRVSFFTASDYALDQLQDDDFQFRVGLSASYPLYDAGETRAIIDNAESFFRRSTLNIRREREVTALQVTEKYFTLRNQIELLRITHEKEDRFARDWERAQIDFENGAISKIDHDKFKQAYMLSLNRMKGLELDVMLAQSGLLNTIGIRNFNELMK